MNTMTKIVLSLLIVPALGMAGPLEPTSPPGSSIYTLQAIFEKLSNAIPGQILSATSTVVTAGYYDNATLHAIETDLVAANIRPGAVIFGITGDVSTPAGMSLIPGGSFMMGATTNVGHESISDASPQHTVYVSAFYLDQYEVTKSLWDAVRAHNGGNTYSYSTSAGQGKATNHPVHTVNWFDAVKWCNARSEMEGLTPVYYTDAGFTTVYKTGAVAPYADASANGYRLPTEAEWEKAARGGAGANRFPWSDTITHNDANYTSHSAFAYDTSNTRGYHPIFYTGSSPYTSPVGYFAPNGYGLYDMAGNVLEWCWDWYSSSYYSSSPSTDPEGPSSGSNRVLRGGSWDYYASFTRAASRLGMNQDAENANFGFRCARGL